MRWSAILRRGMCRFRGAAFLAAFLGIAGFSFAQRFPMEGARIYYDDSVRVIPQKTWKAVAEVAALNLGVWGFDRFVMNEDFARINWQTIKSNFRTGPVWDTDKFSTNLVAHPYHGSLYYNAARSNGMNFWQSIPFTAGGSLMWEFFMEAEPPSINDMLATTFGGIELGEITFRLSDLFIDDRTTGLERVGREVLAGLVSPVRGINRLISGDAWRKSSSKGRSFSSVPLLFMLSAGPRFLAEQERSGSGMAGMEVGLRLDYGNPFNDDYYQPYEWFILRGGFDFFSSQPLISQVSAIGALWGKKVWEKGNRRLAAGVFQHFDYYDSALKEGSGQSSVPYRISQTAALGPGLIYYKNGDHDKVDVFATLYANVIGLGASLSDYLQLEERDYNLGSGYSVKSYAGVVYDKRWSFQLDLENYHIFTWKGYEPGLDWDNTDLTTLNVQGEKSNARLTVFSATFAYASRQGWSLAWSNRFFSRHTKYKYFEDVESSTYDIKLSLGWRF